MGMASMKRNFYCIELHIGNNYIFNIKHIFYLFYKNLIQYCVRVWTAWDIDCNFKWFYLWKIEQILFFTSILLKHPENGRKSDRSM